MVAELAALKADAMVDQLVFLMADQRAVWSAKIPVDLTVAVLAEH